MPDPNNPLETALRELKDLLGLDNKFDRTKLTLIRAILINFRNRELTDDGH